MFRLTWLKHSDVWRKPEKMKPHQKYFCCQPLLLVPDSYSVVFDWSFWNCFILGDLGWVKDVVPRPFSYCNSPRFSTNRKDWAQVRFVPLFNKTPIQKLWNKSCPALRSPISANPGSYPALRSPISAKSIGFIRRISTNRALNNRNQRVNKKSTVSMHVWSRLWLEKSYERHFYFQVKLLLMLKVSW